jgi:hypothetical protein
MPKVLILIVNSSIKNKKINKEKLNYKIKK